MTDLLKLGHGSIGFEALTYPLARLLPTPPIGVTSNYVHVICENHVLKGNDGNIAEGYLRFITYYPITPGLNTTYDLYVFYWNGTWRHDGVWHPMENWFSRDFGSQRVFTRTIGSTGNYYYWYFPVYSEHITFVASSYANLASADPAFHPYLAFIDAYGNVMKIGSGNFDGSLTVSKITATSGREFIQVQETSGYRRLFILSSVPLDIYIGQVPTS